MFILDISNPAYTLTFLILSICVILLGKETKKSAIPAALLVFYLILIVMHIVQLITLPVEYSNLFIQLTHCLTYDFGFILLSYISYLWIDDIEAKYKNKKSIDNSLDWFWKKV